MKRKPSTVPTKILKIAGRTLKKSRLLLSMVSNLQKEEKGCFSQDTYDSFPTSTVSWLSYISKK